MNTFRKYLLSSVAFDKPDDAAVTPPTPRELAKLQREQIVVEQGEKTVEAKEENENDVKDEKVDDKEEVTEDDKEEVEEIDAAGEDDDKKEEKDPAILKLEKTIERLQRRVDRQTGTSKTLERQLKEAQDALSAKEETKEDKVLTAEDLEKEIDKRASAKIASNEFDAICDRLANDAVKVDKDFDKKIIDLSKEIAPLPGHMIGILNELDNGGAILAHFVNNPEEYEDAIKLSITKMAVELTGLSTKIKDASKPKPKGVSQVPAPNKQLDGSNRNTTNIPLTSIKDEKAWFEARNKDVANKRASGRINLR